MKEEGVIVIEGIPVQFLPAERGLVREALDEARSIHFKGTNVRVISPEYLAAIMLETGRAKDRERLVKFLEEVELDRALLEGIIERYGLDKGWLSIGRG